MFSYEKIGFSNLTSAPAVERVVEFSPSGIDAAAIVRVLSLAADGKAVSAEAGDGYAEVSGRVNFRLAYVNRDGEAAGADYNADFSLRVEGDFTLNDSVVADVTVLEADVAAGDSLTFSAVISVKASCVRREEINVLTDAEQCYKTTETLTLPVLVAAKTVSVPVSDEAEAGEVDRVVLCDGQAVVTATSAENGKVVVEGNVSAAVSYVEDGRLETVRFEIPFTEEIIADGAEEGDRVSASAVVRNCKIVLAGVTGANIVRFEADVAVRALVTRMSSTEVVDDLFMLTNETDITRQTAAYRVFCGQNYISEKVTGTAPLGDRPDAQSVIAVPYARCTVARTERTDSGVTVEGVLTADVVYRDENGLNSVRAEVPFSFEKTGDYGDNLTACCLVERVSAKARRGTDIDIDASVGIMLSSYCEGASSYVAEVVAGAEKEQNTAAISLYIAQEGDTMWELCKALTATPDEIMGQNPALTVPLKEGERVVYFRALGL